MKVSELQGAALDWAVAKCEGMDKYFDPEDGCAFDDEGCAYEPSCNWAQGGPIIEREAINLRALGSALWEAETWDCHGKQDFSNGTTPLVAAMRCYVASKLGDEVDIPDELLQGGLVR